MGAGERDDPARSREEEAARSLKKKKEEGKKPRDLSIEESLRAPHWYAVNYGGFPGEIFALF